MTAAEKVFKEGFAPNLSNLELTHLLKALTDDNERLIQGGTTKPPPLMCVQNWPVEAACAISFMGWRSGLETVGEVEEYFAKKCFEADQILGEPAACRWFLNWYDDFPREVVFHDLKSWIKEILAQRNTPKE
jgi:hypothetical protein